MAKLIAHQNSVCPAMDPVVQIEWMECLTQGQSPNAIVCPTRLLEQVEVIDETRLVFISVPQQSDPVHKFTVIDH
jgi:hypothetical protein